jgi:hypothetical protein
MLKEHGQLVQSKGFEMVKLTKEVGVEVNVHKAFGDCM